MASRNGQIREYQNKKREMKNNFSAQEEEHDERYRQTREKYKDDPSTFGKVARVSNDVLHGAVKVLGFLIKNS